MQQNKKKFSAGGSLVLITTLLNAVVLTQGYISHPDWYAQLLLTLPLMLVSVLLFKRRLL